MANGLPGNGASCAADDKTGQRAIFEHFKGGAIGNSITKLASPASVTEPSKVVAVRRTRGRGGVRISFFVVMVGEVIECLNG